MDSRCTRGELELKISLCLFLVLWAASGWNQSPPPSSAPAGAKLRIWFAVPPDQPPPKPGDLLTLKTPYEVTWGATNTRGAVCERPYAEGGYRDFPGAPLTVTLKKGTEPKTAIGTATLPLKTGGWYTLVVNPAKPSAWHALLEDKLQKPPPPSGKEASVPEPADSQVPVRFVSLVTGAQAEFELTKTKQKASVDASTEQGKVLFRLPPGIHPVTVKGRCKEQDFQRGLELEIAGGDRPILMFTEDIYGRLRIPCKSLPPP